MATRIVGDLDMTDLRQQMLDGPQQVALHDLHVIDVVLQPTLARPARAMQSSASAVPSSR